MGSRTGLVTLLLALTGCNAAEAGALNDLYQKALRNDPQLRAAEATFHADSEALPKARSALLPQLSLSADATHTDSSIASTDGNSHGYTLSLSQPVFDASRWFSFKRGELLSDRAKLVFSQAQQSLILRTVTAYLNALRAESTLDLAHARERAFKRRLDQVHAQFEVGLIAITDVQEAQASYDDAAVKLIDAKGALRNSYESLERLSGTLIDQVPLLKDSYPITSATPAIAKPWVKRALNDNLTYRISQIDLQAARRAAQVARADRLPTLALEARSGESTQRGDWNNNNSVALTLSMPLYTGGSLGSSVRETEQRQQAALYSREDSRRAVTEQTRSLLRDLNTSVESVKARAQSIKSRKTALEATEEGFKVGTRNVVDVLDAENALYQARLDYANARYSHIDTLFKFKQAVGTLSPDDLKALDAWLADEPSPKP